MKTYRLIKNPFLQQIDSVQRFSDNAFIPLDPANSDYQKFKVDVMEGAELQDADGNVMTPDEAMAFISNLP